MPEHPTLVVGTPYTIDDHAQVYYDSFINDNSETVCESLASLACLDNHTMAEAVAITAKVVEMLARKPPHRPLVRKFFVDGFVRQLKIQAEK